MNNLYLIKNQEREYECYGTIVVAAESEDVARQIHPDPAIRHDGVGDWIETDALGNTHVSTRYKWLWVTADAIASLKVEHIGVTERERGVIFAEII